MTPDHTGPWPGIRWARPCYRGAAWGLIQAAVPLGF